MRTFILADNQYITKEGLRTIISDLSLSDSILEASSLKELQNKLKNDPSAVVVLDYTLFDFSSLQQMLIVKDSFKESSWILFSDDLGTVFLRHTLLSDPSISIVMKHNDQEEIVAALQNTVYYATYICDCIAQILQGDIPSNLTPNTLTASEKAILHEITLGKTTKEIAMEKNLSFHTVNSHRKNIFRKIEVNNVQEAVKYAIKAGLADLTDYYI